MKADAVCRIIDIRFSRSCAVLSFSRFGLFSVRMMIGKESHGLQSRCTQRIPHFQWNLPTVYKAFAVSFSFAFFATVRMSLLLIHSLEMQSDKRRAIARRFHFDFFLIVPCRCSMNCRTHTHARASNRIVWCSCSRFDCPHFDKCVQNVYFLHLFLSFPFTLPNRSFRKSRNYNA